MVKRFRVGQVAHELMRRKVVRVGIGYIVIMWLLLQVAEVTFEPLRLPEWSLTLLIVFAVIGFPVAAILAWIFEVTPQGLQRDPGDTAPGNDEKKQNSHSRSVAVLPFADMSPAQDQRYFCEGIAEEILSSLCSVKYLHVPSRTSSFRYDAEIHDICEIGTALGVETVLEGSVRKDEDQLRITAQLIDAKDGFHLWAKTYDTHLSGVLAVQTELARDIVHMLCESLTDDDIISPAPAPEDIQAYDYYLQGRHFLNRFSIQGAEFAVEMFARAVAEDPEYSLAWAGLTQAHTFLSMYEGNTREHRDQARIAAEKTVQLAPDSVPAITARGMALMINGQPAAAEIAFREALDINPDYFLAIYYHARCCQLQGDLAQAAELFERAAQRRPTDYETPLLALSVYRAGSDTDRANRAAKRGREAAKGHLMLHPDDARAWYLGAMALLQLDETARGRRWIERAIRVRPDDSLVRYNAACFYAQTGDIDAALENLDQVSPACVALSDWAGNDPDLDPLRKHQRFNSLLQRSTYATADTGQIAV